jgi:hypothetical protein
VTTPHGPATSRCSNHRYYRLTCEDYDALLERANNKCQICEIRAEYTRHHFLHIDHDHTIGRWGVRGLLCVQCNTSLGDYIRWGDTRSLTYIAQPLFQRVSPIYLDVEYAVEIDAYSPEQIRERQLQQGRLVKDLQNANRKRRRLEKKTIQDWEVTAILAALNAGIRKSKVSRESGRSTAAVSRIAVAHGLMPDPVRSQQSRNMWERWRSVS